MSPVYLNPQHSSSIPFLDLKGDQQHNLHVYGHVYDLATSYHSNFLLENHHTSDENLTLNHSNLVQEKVEKMVLSLDQKHSDHGQELSSPPWSHNIGDGGDYNHLFDRREDDHKTEIMNDSKQPKKPSKLKIMRKTTTMNSKKIGDNNLQHDHSQSKIHRRSNSNDNNNGTRVCSDCHTTSTPLWRSGPLGPKSLCNACGIRQRKARRAAMASAAAAGLANDGVVLASSSTSSSSITGTPKPMVKEQMIKSERQLDHDYESHTLPIKKRSKTIHTAKNFYNNNPHEGDKLFFEDFGLSSRNDLIKPSTQRAFPRDEEEGAILLMALSCGLACSS